MIDTLESRLSGERLGKARLQDTVIRIIFDTTSDAVFHGGTCVWRCYNGKRFSKDIDIYISKDSSIKKVLNRLVLESLKVKKDAQKGSTLFYSVENSTDISLRISKLKIDGEVVPYTLADGTMMSSYSLLPEEMVHEKINAYSDRRLERDLYDMMILLNSVAEKETVKKNLGIFLKHIDLPKDPGALKDLIYEGPVPSAAEIINYLKRWSGT